ncbi:hypothetical protein AGMMS49525_01830 [Bacteroidia bacterium]|nr:hypothetical protein AGMMS49525_01830 [Bacteroidia bacterium]
MQTQEVINLITQKQSLTEKTLSKLQLLTEEYPYFTAAQVLFTLNLKNQKDSRFNANLRKAACYIGDRRQLFNLTEPPVSITNHQSSDISDPLSDVDEGELYLPEKQPVGELQVEPAMTTTAVIDSFLAQQPEGQTTELIYAPSADYADQFLGDVENLDESVDTESFFSETLAKIYIKQKKYDKALEIIYKLNLHYPEKSRYFADQIRFLEKLITNSKK